MNCFWSASIASHDLFDRCEAIIFSRININRFKKEVFVTNDQENLVKNTWKIIFTKRYRFGSNLLIKLFQLDPQLVPLFHGNIDVQGRKIINMLDIIVTGQKNIIDLDPALLELAVRHKAYGVQPHHFDLLGIAFMETLSQELGEQFSAEVESAWQTMYEGVARIMVKKIR